MVVSRSSVRSELLDRMPGHWPNRIRLALLVVLLVGFGWWCWWWLEAGGRDRFFPRNFGVVDAGRIYRSGQIDGGLVRDVLAGHGVDVIVNLANDIPGDPDKDAERAAIGELGIRRIDIPALDGHGIGPIEHYADALTAVVAARRRGEVVLIHCQGGSERTGALVAFYRLLIEQSEPERVYAEMLAYNHRPHRNGYLIPYINDHLKKLAQLLVARGVLARVPAPMPQLPVPATLKDTDGQ